MTSRPEAGRVSVEAMPERPLPAPAPTDLLPLPLLAWDTCEAQVVFQSHPAPSSDPVSFPKATTMGLGQAPARVHQQLYLNTGRNRQALSEVCEHPPGMLWTEVSSDWNALMLC